MAIVVYTCEKCKEQQAMRGVPNNEEDIMLCDIWAATQICKCGGRLDTDSKEIINH